MQQITVPILMDILERAGGAAADVDLTADVADVELQGLGYDSLAILEAAGLVEREYGVVLDEAALFDARTPHELTTVVNEALAAKTAQPPAAHQHATGRGQR